MICTINKRMIPSAEAFTACGSRSQKIRKPAYAECLKLGLRGLFGPWRAKIEHDRISDTRTYLRCRWRKVVLLQTLLFQVEAVQSVTVEPSNAVVPMPLRTTGIDL